MQSVILGYRLRVYLVLFPLQDPQLLFHPQLDCIHHSPPRKSSTSRRQNTPIDFPILEPLHSGHDLPLLPYITFDLGGIRLYDEMRDGRGLSEGLERQKFGFVVGPWGSNRSGEIRGVRRRVGVEEERGARLGCEVRDVEVDVRLGWKDGSMPGSYPGRKWTYRRFGFWNKYRGRARMLVHQDSCASKPE